jgi:signal recognition particle receptor subunit beta
VFVADSSPDQRQANRAAWQNLVANLTAFALDKVPIVVQYNKRDLPERVPIDQCDHFGNPARTIHEACAKDGDGVVPTFFDLVGEAWNHLDRELQLASRLGIDAAAFREALAEHVGVTRFVLPPD